MMKLIYTIFSFIFACIFLFFIFFEFPNYLIEFNENLGLPCWNNEAGKFVGAGLIALGILSWLYCAIIFGESGDGTPLPAAPPTKLVVKGIYRYIRNPIYVAFIVILFGIFLLKGHLLLLFHVLFCFIIFHLYIILREEPLLRLRFGEEYERYVRTVPRWLPIWTRFKKNQNN